MSYKANSKSKFAQLQAYETVIDKQLPSQLSQNLRECTNAIHKLTAVLEWKTKLMFQPISQEKPTREGSEAAKKARIPRERLHKIRVRQDSKKNPGVEERKSDTENGERSRKNLLMTGKMGETQKESDWQRLRDNVIEYSSESQDREKDKGGVVEAGEGQEQPKKEGKGDGMTERGKSQEKKEKKEKEKVESQRSQREEKVGERRGWVEDTVENRGDGEEGEEERVWERVEKKGSKVEEETQKRQEGQKEQKAGEKVGNRAEERVNQKVNTKRDSVDTRVDTITNKAGIWNKNQRLKTIQAQIPRGEGHSLSHISSVLSDYEDNFITVKMIDLDKILKPLSSDKNDLEEKLHYDGLFNVEFSRWVTNLLDNVCKSSFYGFINKNMDKSRTKVYFSRNCLYNLILLKEELMREERVRKYVTNIIGMFNSHAKESLKFLKLKYPQQDKVSLDEEISKMIPSKSAEDYFNDHLPKSLSLREVTHSHVKEFINKLVSQTKAKFHLFNTHLNQLFKGFSLQNSRFSFEINSKIKDSTPKYSQEEIQQGGMEIKSTEIMRIIIKWISSLQEQIIIHSGKQDGTKWVDNCSAQLSTSLSKLLTQIMNQYSQNFQESFSNVQEKEFKTNLFAAVSSLGLSNTVLKYLFKLLQKVSELIKKSNYGKSNLEKDDIWFKIFDLFRGKCSGSEQDIKKVYQKIKKSNVFEIVQVKNRMDTPNRDFLINLTMKGTVFICQLQLHINTGAKTDKLKEHRGHCEIDFNHFLYELERAKFGPVGEMVSVYSENSDLPGFFRINKLNSLRSKVQTPKFKEKVGVSSEYELVWKNPTEKKDSVGKGRETAKESVRETVVRETVRETVEGKDKDGREANDKAVKLSLIRQKLTLYICDYCCRVSESDSLRFWGVNEKGVVCEMCIVKTLSTAEKKRLFFREYNGSFQRIQSLQDLKKQKVIEGSDYSDNQGEEQGEKEKKGRDTRGSVSVNDSTTATSQQRDQERHWREYIVTVDKISHQIQKYQLSSHIIHRINSNVPMEADRLEEESRNSYLFCLRNNCSVKVSKLTGQVYNKIRREDIEEYKLHSLLLSHLEIWIHYIQNPSSDIYILYLSTSVYESNDKRESLMYQIESSRGQCSIRNKYDYKMYRWIPLQFKNSLVFLEITSGLSNFPLLNSLSLQKLVLRIECGRLQGLQCNNLKLNNIQSLTVQFESTDQSHEEDTIFNLYNFQSDNLKVLDIGFSGFQSVIALCSQRSSQKIEEQNFISQQNDKKESELQSQPQPSFQSLPSLTTLQLFFNESPKIKILFMAVCKQNIEEITIDTAKMSTSVIDLSKCKFNNLRHLTINESGLISRRQVILHGFQLENEQSEVFPKLQELTINGVVSSDLRNMNLQQLAKFNHRQPLLGMEFEKAQVIYPPSGCSNLKEMKLSNHYYNHCIPIRGLDKLEKLTIQSLDQLRNYDFDPNTVLTTRIEEMVDNQLRVTQTIQVRSTTQYYQSLSLNKLLFDGWRKLKELVLKVRGEEYIPELNGFEIMYQNHVHILRLEQELDSLEILEIKYYNQIEITSSLPSLRELRILQHQSNSINLESIVSPQLYLLKLSEYKTNRGEISIKLNPDLTRTVRVIELQSRSNLYKFQGSQVLKTYFWNLEEIRLRFNNQLSGNQEVRIKTRDLKTWVKLNEQETLQEISSILKKEEDESIKQKKQQESIESKALPAKPRLKKGPSKQF